MAHEYETGWVAHTAAWHQLADVKDFRPKTWEEARGHYLPWEPVRQPIYTLPTEGEPVRIPGWSQIVRSDNGYTLSVQEDSYAVISNSEFGNLIEFAMGVDLPGMPPLEFETVSVMRKGQVIAVSLFVREPFHISGDASNTYGFLNFSTHHDGSGGMKCGAGLFRVVCGNTQRAHEALAQRHGFMFNIRHTSNWATQMETARRAIVAAIGGVQAQRSLAEEMVARKVSEAEAEAYVELWLPITDKMSELSRRAVMRKRAAFWTVYASRTCEGITGTAYGLSQAAVEACDHVFRSQSVETRTARVMLGSYEPKKRALALARKLV